jgi:hypothetical protein
MEREAEIEKKKKSDESQTADARANEEAVFVTPKSTSRKAQIAKSPAQKWLQVLFSAFARANDNILPLLREMSTISLTSNNNTTSNKDTTFENDELGRALASLDVLGSFEEPMRQGVSVVKTKRAFPMWHRLGTVRHYTAGTSHAYVCFDDKAYLKHKNAGTEKEERKNENSNNKQPQFREPGEWVGVWKLMPLAEYPPGCLPRSEQDHFEDTSRQQQDANGSAKIDSAKGVELPGEFNARALLSQALVTPVIEHALGASLYSDRLIYKTLSSLLVCVSPLC